MKITKINFKNKPLVEEVENNANRKPALDLEDKVRASVDIVYADAVKNSENNRKLVKDRVKEVEKVTKELEKETVDRKENQTPKSQELKKMKLNESLISNIRSEVKEVLLDHLTDSFEYNQALFIPTDVEEYDPAWCLETASHPLYAKTENSRNNYIDSLLDMLFYYAPKDVKEGYVYDYRTAADDLISAIEDGFVDWETVARACLSYMSSDDIYDMCRLNDFSIHNPEIDGELDESREPHRGDAEKASFVVDADGERFAFDTKQDMEEWIRRNEASFEEIEIVKQELEEEQLNEISSAVAKKSIYDCLWDQVLTVLSYSGENKYIKVTPYPYDFTEVKAARYDEREGYDTLVVDSPNLEPAKQIAEKFNLEYRVDRKGRLLIFIPEDAPVNREIEDEFAAADAEMKRKWAADRKAVKLARKKAGRDIEEELEDKGEQILTEKESSTYNKIKEAGKEKELNDILKELYPEADEEMKKNIVEQDKQWFYTMLGMEE